MEGANLNPEGAATAPESTQRTFDDSTMSKLNALGIDPSDTSAMADLGFGSMTSDPDKGDNNSIAHLQAEGDSSYQNTQQPAAEPQGTQEPAATEPQANPDSAESATTVDHSFLGGKKDLGASTKPAPTDLKGLEDVNQYIASKIEGVQDVDSLLSNYEKMNSEMEAYKTIKAEYDRIEKSFETMPPELLKAIDMAEKGEDWKSLLSSSPKLDFGLDADSISKEDLVKTYFGDQFTADDFEAADPNSDYHDANVERMVNLAHAQAKEKFNADKAKNTLTLEQAKRSSQEKAELYNSSVSKSLGSVKSFIPDVSEEYLSSISSDLLESKQNLLFSNPDGTVKDDAALRYALAKDGVEIFQQLQKVIQSQAETITNQELLARKSQTPPAGSGSSPANANSGIRPEVAEYIKNL